jgi:hypothetical protein
MSQKTRRNEITKKRVVYHLPAADAVRIDRDVEYRTTDAGVLTMDVYFPQDWKSGERTPSVILVTGYSDIGFQRILGCKLKEMESYVSWGQLMAASGIVAITYSAVEPEVDTKALLHYVRQNAGSLGIDEERIGVWACSGNVPNALSLLMQKDREYLKCAVFCYGVMLDLDGYTSTADSSKLFGFVNPCAGKSVDDLPQDVPLFIVRAGKDEMPHLNDTLDRFVGKALSRNLPITFTNHATAPHAFDVMDDSETSRQIIRQILAFMQFHLMERETNASVSSTPRANEDSAKERTKK